MMTLVHSCSPQPQKSYDVVDLFQLPDQGQRSTGKFRDERYSDVRLEGNERTILRRIRILCWLNLTPDFQPLSDHNWQTSFLHTSCGCFAFISYITHIPIHFSFTTPWEIWRLYSVYWYVEGVCAMHVLYSLAPYIYIHELTNADSPMLWTL